ncbi:hypothetical protein [Tannockella kyphosi]|uniref:hypothetical protein n=1 Tax=Tannockella kyphosi TaxID=2899121 RepID=UPI002012CFED|nr:hypothetical protein [Tannockella kyphosi]
MKKDKILDISTIVFSVIVIALSVIYVITGNMIPGLNPLCLSVLIIFMFFNDKITGKNIYMKSLFLIAASLNVIAGIIQLVNH